jgi:hypothetical protein
MKWVLLGALVLVVLIILEGRRQERKYGRSGRGSLIGAGLVDLQRHLEPERKMEIVLKKTDRTVGAESGDEPDKLGEPDSDRE